MQHRFDFRLGLKLPVTMEFHVDRSTQNIVCGRTRNISFTGVFVELRNIALPDDFPVKRYVNICLHNNPCGDIKIGGLIVRRATDGIGVLFDDYNTDVSRRLSRIISLCLDNSLHLDNGARTRPRGVSAAPS